MLRNKCVYYSNDACQVDLCVCLPSLPELTLQNYFGNKKLSVENTRGKHLPPMGSTWCTVTEVWSLQNYPKFRCLVFYVTTSYPTLILNLHSYQFNFHLGYM